MKKQNYISYMKTIYKIILKRSMSEIFILMSGVGKRAAMNV